MLEQEDSKNVVQSVRKYSAAKMTNNFEENHVMSLWDH